MTDIPRVSLLVLWLVVLACAAVYVLLTVAVLAARSALLVLMWAGLPFVAVLGCALMVRVSKAVNR